MNNPQSTGKFLNHWAGLLGLGWFVLVVAVYYVSHKPFTPETALNLVGIFWRVVAALLVWGLAGGLGHRLVGDLPISPLENIAVQSALGAGLAGTAWLLIGVSLGFGWILGLLIGLVLWIFLFKDVCAWAVHLRALGESWRASGRFGKLVGAEIFVVLLFTWIVAVAPPLKFDALVYHLQLPHLYIDNGRFYYVPDIMFWGMPQVGEMLYTWAISIGGDASATLIGWLAGLTALIGLFGLLKSRLGLQAAWSGLAALLVGYTLASSLGWGYVDWLVILFGTAFLIGMHAWVGQHSLRWLGIAGASAGMALATKYTAGILILSGMFFIVWDGIRRKDWIGAVRSLLLFCTVGLLVFAPWLAKNWLYTGSPVYPFLFPAGAMDPIRLEYYQGGAAWGNWMDTLFLPWRATAIGSEATPGYSASIGPLLLGLSLMAWLGMRRISPQKQAFLKNTTLLVVPVIVVWMILGRFSSYLLQSRLYLGIFPAIAVLAGAGYLSFSRSRVSSVRLGRISAGLILFVMGLTVFEVASSVLHQGSPLYVVGLMSEQDYLQQNLGAYARAMDQINELPPDAKVLFLWETRSLGCKHSCDPDEILDHWLHDWAVAQDVGRIEADWKMQGYTHVLYYTVGADFLQHEDIRYQNLDWGSLDTLRARLVNLTDVDGVYDLYEIP